MEIHDEQLMLQYPYSIVYTYPLFISPHPPLNHPPLPPRAPRLPQPRDSPEVEHIGQVLVSNYRIIVADRFSEK